MFHACAARFLKIFLILVGTKQGLSISVSTLRGSGRSAMLDLLSYVLTTYQKVNPEVLNILYAILEFCNVLQLLVHDSTVG